LAPKKTRVPGLPYGVVCVILDITLTVLVEHRLVTHGRTDGQTDEHDDGKYRASIASRGKTWWRRGISGALRVLLC